MTRAKAPINYRALLDAMPIKPLIRPPIPAFNRLNPAMSRSAWLSKAREDHRILAMSTKLLDLYDNELERIPVDIPDGLQLLDARLVDIQQRYWQGVSVIAATRARIASAIGQQGREAAA